MSAGPAGPGGIEDEPGCIRLAGLFLFSAAPFPAILRIPHYHINEFIFTSKQLKFDNPPSLILDVSYVKWLNAKTKQAAKKEELE